MNDTSATAAAHDHFMRVVPNWSYLGPPLRPSPDDTAVVQRVVAGLGGGAHAVVLGLTPEIIGCTWPADIELSAVDHSPSMIKALWPPAKGPVNARVVMADWCAMPIEAGTIDLVAGDGCYMLLKFGDDQARLSREIHRVLRPGGQFVIRAFLRPDQAESVDAISRAFSAGEIGSVHALKLRLFAALQDNSGAGCCLDDVWHIWKLMPDLPATLVGTRGWTKEEIGGIESYKGMQARYFQPTLTELRRALAPFFRELECAVGNHELADRCPTLVLIRD